VLVREVILTLTADEVDQRHLAVAAEPVDRGDEVLGDRVHQRRGRERRLPVPPEGPHHPAGILQPRLVDVEVHPVDALHLQGDVLIQDTGDAAG
jgi:hypothetical protein